MRAAVTALNSGVGRWPDMSDTAFPLRVGCSVFGWGAQPGERSRFGKFVIVRWLFSSGRAHPFYQALPTPIRVCPECISDTVIPAGDSMPLSAFPCRVGSVIGHLWAKPLQADFLGQLPIILWG